MYKLAVAILLLSAVLRSADVAAAGNGGTGDCDEMNFFVHGRSMTIS
jgi:hypothetical protein